MMQESNIRMPVSTPQANHGGNAEMKAKLDERFLANIQGRDFVLYAGLLDLSHQMGLLKLEVEILQYPTKDNSVTAICKAIATSQDGSVFSDIGDANPANVNKKIAPHILRMASTRAKARALRDLTNIGITCLEELGDFDEVMGEGFENHNPKRGNGRRNASTDNNSSEKASKSPAPSGQNATSPPSPNPPRSNNSKGNSPDSAKSQPESSPKMSEAQRRAILNLAGRRGINEAELQRMAQERYGLNLEQLPSSDASSFIRYLQQSA